MSSSPVATASATASVTDADTKPSAKTDNNMITTLEEAQKGLNEIHSKAPQQTGSAPTKEEIEQLRKHKTAVKTFLDKLPLDLKQQFNSHGMLKNGSKKSKQQQQSAATKKGGGGGGANKKKKKNQTQNQTIATLTVPMDVDNNNNQCKTIYLIRHGRSQGQDAKRNGLNRKSDPKLLDCGLTSRGESEAMHIPKLLGDDILQSIELVVSSPLTRALSTALLGFPQHDILIDYNLRELGSKIPENTPRPIESVLHDLRPLLKHRSENNDNNVTIDYESLQPANWPKEDEMIMIERGGGQRSGNRLQESFQRLYNSRPEQTIAVVCHYNVIRGSVVNGNSLRPENAIPLKCKLHMNGALTLDLTY